LLGSEPLGLGHTRADWDDLSEYVDFLKTTSKPRILYFSSWTVGPATQKYIPDRKSHYEQIGSSNNSRAYHRAPTRQQLLTKS